MCGSLHILGIIRMEDDPNSFDLQKDSLCRGDSYSSPLCVTGVNLRFQKMFHIDPYFICHLNKTVS